MTWAGDVQEDMSPRSLPDIHHDDKSVAANLPRIPVKHVNTSHSMLSYSEHMRKLSTSKENRGDDSKLGSDLKNSLSSIHVPRKKALSLNDFIEKRKKVPSVNRSNMKAARSLPNLRTKQIPPKTLRISFVSASDLHDIINYALKTKDGSSVNPKQSLWEKPKIAQINPCRFEVNRYHYNTTRRMYKDSEITLRHNELYFRSELPEQKDTAVKQLGTAERDAVTFLTTQSPYSLDVDKRRRPRETKHTSSHTRDDDDTTERRQSGPVVTISDITQRGDFLRYRPRRAKRMILHRPDLGVIEESDGNVGNQVNIGATDSTTVVDELIQMSKDLLTDSNTQESTCSNDEAHVATKAHNPEQEHTDISDNALRIHVHKPLCLMNESVKPVTAAHKSVSDNKHTEKVTLSNRGKAQKKIHKLVFLRDYSKRHYKRK